MGKVLVRDMSVGKKYKLNNGDVVVLEIKEVTGAGGSGNQEPIYKLVFSNTFCGIIYPNYVNLYR